MSVVGATCREGSFVSLLWLAFKLIRFSNCVRDSGRDVSSFFDRLMDVS
jgi:hypothetical protein